MATNEAGRQDGQFIVICMTPDVCKTPTVPVPYPIVAFLDQSVRTSPDVNFRDDPAFTMHSRVKRVIGDEPGVGGGVMSGVNRGMCRPITHTPSVRVNGHYVVYHRDSTYWMNCRGPDGPGNTTGRVYFLGLMLSAAVDPSGTIPPADPPVGPETAAEAAYLAGPGKAVGGPGGVVGLARPAGVPPPGPVAATVDYSNPGSVLAAAMSLGGASLGGGRRGGGA